MTRQNDFLELPSSTIEKDYGGNLMKKITLILVVCLQLACGIFSTPEPTPTQQPSVTFTPIPTATEKPTSIPEIDFGDMTQLVVLNGYTIGVPILYEYQINNNIIIISDETGTFTISFSGEEYDGVTPLAQIIEVYLQSLEKRDGQFERGQPEDIMVDGEKGIAIHIIGQLGNVPLEGTAVAVSPNSDFVLFGLSTSTISVNKDLWKDEHKSLFEAFLETVKFVDTTGSCIISSDNTYGYTEENPIKVGGDFINGPSRERAYLDNLLGPNGEMLSYERQGSLMRGDVILDAYQVTGSGINETLYIDMYDFEGPQAPIGFTCKGEFPLTTP